jgi:hypothetical protein
MRFGKNQFGVPQFPGDDARRLLVLLAAIDLLERPTTSAIADLTSFDKDSVDDQVNMLREQFGVVLHKVGEVYHIESWGDLLKQEGVRKLITPESRQE